MWQWMVRYSDTQLFTPLSVDQKICQWSFDTSSMEEMETVENPMKYARHYWAGLGGSYHHQHLLSHGKLRVSREPPGAGTISIQGE